MNDFIKELRKARSGLVLDFPYFATPVFHLKMVIDESCATGWTDGRSIGVNPEWFRQHNPQEQIGFFAHEGMHAALGHHIRIIPLAKTATDKVLANMAGDHVVNLILKEARVKLPGEPLCDERFKGMSLEKVFHILKKEEKKKPGRHTRPGPGNGKESGKGQTHPDPGGCGEVRPMPVAGPGRIPSDGEMKAEESKWKVILTQAAKIAKSRGNLPSGLARLIQELVEPKLPWQEIVARFVDNTAKNDFTWRRPNRRYVTQQVYLPTLLSPELSGVVLAFDTSGSMSPKDIVDCVSEVMGIMMTYATTELLLVYCDAAVAGHQTISSDDMFTLTDVIKPQGGGGTRFAPVFRWIEENDIEARAVVYFTDGYASDFGPEPEYDVLWIITQDGRSHFSPPFGEVVNM